jgi:hypothetical protein
VEQGHLWISVVRGADILIAIPSQQILDVIEGAFSVSENMIQGEHEPIVIDDLNFDRQSHICRAVLAVDVFRVCDSLQFSDLTVEIALDFGGSHRRPALVFESKLESLVMRDELLEARGEAYQVERLFKCQSQPHGIPFEKRFDCSDKETADASDVQTILRPRVVRGHYTATNGSIRPEFIRK